MTDHDLDEVEQDEDFEPDDLEDELDDEWDEDFDADEDLEDDLEDDLDDGLGEDEDEDEDEGEDEDEDDEDREEALDELEAEELDMLTDDEESETLIVDEATELRAIRRAELAMEGEVAGGRGEDEFVCQSCFLVLKTSQLANRRKMLCRDCAA